jgi:dCTP deaminase
MMIVNGKRLILAAPIKDMLDHKVRGSLSSHGLSEAGYDIRLKQEIEFSYGRVYVDGIRTTLGNFALASAIEEFQMPTNLVGIVHDKSTWARRGLSVFNTVIEPGWNGFLTLELVYHGSDLLTIPAGSGIAQVLFHHTLELAQYEGKYQGQPDRPVEARHE